MASSNSPSKVIAILIVIALATVALLGAEAWNRGHQGRTSVTAATATGPDAQSQATAATAPSGDKAAPKPAASTNRHDELINE